MAKGTIEKGKPFVRMGRKATGLQELKEKVIEYR